MLRLNDETSEKLDTLTRGFNRPAVEVIRHLIAQATPEDFPQSWRLAAAAHRPQDTRPADRGTPESGHRRTVMEERREIHH
jgi:hypothetical protein